MKDSFVFFSADQHYFHKNIIGLSNRPYSSLEDMHRDLIQRHNSVVTPNDTVINLGDFTCGGTAEQLADIRSYLNGTQFIVLGNHDRSATCLTNSGFQVVTSTWTHYILCNKIPVILSHVPPAPDKKIDKHAKRRPPHDTGRWILHGHVHNKYRTLAKQFNVGVDVNEFTPVHENAVRAIIEGNL